MKVGDIMTREVLTIGPEAELRDVAAILVERNISGMPVCGVQGELLGIISEYDILVKEGGPRDDTGIFGRFLGTGARRARKARALKVKDAMTTQVLTISPYASVAEAARRMPQDIFLARAMEEEACIRRARPAYRETDERLRHLGVGDEEIEASRRRTQDELR